MQVSKATAVRNANLNATPLHTLARFGRAFFALLLARQLEFSRGTGSPEGAIEKPADRLRTADTVLLRQRSTALIVSGEIWISIDVSVPVLSPIDLFLDLFTRDIKFV